MATNIAPAMDIVMLTVVVLATAGVTMFTLMDLIMIMLSNNKTPELLITFTLIMIALSYASVKIASTAVPTNTILMEPSVCFLPVLLQLSLLKDGTFPSEVVNK